MWAVDQNKGKVVFKKEDWQRIHGAAASLLDEPRLKALLAEGEPELSLFATDPDTGVKLKARLDWMAPKLILDVKTFGPRRDQSVDKTGLQRHLVRGLLPPDDVLLAGARLAEGLESRLCSGLRGVGSSVQTRIKVLRSKLAGEPSMYWTRALLEIRGAIRRYKELFEHFGVDQPWRYACDLDPLADEEMPQLAYA